MSQEQAGFNQTNADGPASYSAGYEEPPRYGNYAFGTVGQKLSDREGNKGPSWSQRLALAIVSLLSLLAMFIVAVGLAFANIAPNIVENYLAPLVALTFIGFFVVVIVINVMFNRKR